MNSNAFNVEHVISVKLTKISFAGAASAGMFFSLSPIVSAVILVFTIFHTYMEARKNIVRTLLTEVTIEGDQTR
jgi:hypothetical protein